MFYHHGASGFPQFKHTTLKGEGNKRGKDTIREETLRRRREESRKLDKETRGQETRQEETRRERGNGDEERK